MSSPERLWIFKRARFDAAHHLPTYVGLCRNVHGHTYTVEVGVLVNIDPVTGMGIDFRELSKVLEHEILGKFDHSDLNRFFENPTAEVLCSHFHKVVKEHMKEEAASVCVRVYETPDSWVEKTE